ncbi:flagellar protein [Paenibacillus cremeus]|uniref:Flagellar protein n=1 Tax=Paenibacillus cremeus TaxID=2163881 RepID=A0A559KB28_9BACL|nr:flagellar protein [Paenibacillus cremeus]TVY09330.1 flagellar protein [Paenibacillus cremeus]
MSINVANCDRCGKVYLKNIHGICTNCIKDIELQYEKCLKFLREARSCSIQELSDATEVSVKQITKFIREGRISIRNNPNMAYACEACGASIRENILCEPCRSKLSKEAGYLNEIEMRKQERLDKENQVSFKIIDRLQDRNK